MDDEVDDVLDNIEENVNEVEGDVVDHKDIKFQVDEGL